MAKNDKVDFGEADLDDFNFDALDFGDPFEQKAPKSGGAREAVTEFASSAVHAAKDRLLDRGTIRRLISGGLHKGYTQAFNAYDAIEGGLADIIKDNATELNGTLLNMKRKTDRWSPLAKRMMPKFLRDAMEDADYANSSSSSSSGGNDELNINLAGLDKLFASQMKDQTDRKIGDAIRDNREQKRFMTEAQLQLNIGRGIGRLVGYQDNVTINYHRKSLEIGYRQLDVAVRMLQLQNQHFSESGETLKLILKNTGLPDFVKMKHIEVLKQTMANKLASNAMNTVGNWASNFFTGVKQNSSDMLGAFLQFRDTIESQTQLGQSRASAFGSTLGGMAGSFAGGAAEQGLHAVVERLKPYLSKIPGFDRVGENLRSTFTGIPQKINAWSKSENTKDGISGWIEEGLKSLFDTYTATGSISGMPSIELDQPAIFDNLFHKSVTEVIPGYLASIDKWIKVVATGEDQEEMAYSHYTGGMVSRSTLNEQHVRVSLKNNTGKALRQEIDGLLRDMGAADLSNEAQRALRRRLMKDLAGGNPFNPSKYVEVGAWDNTEEWIADEIITFVANRFDLDPSGQPVSQSTESKERLNNFTERYDATQRRMPEFGQRMNVLQKVTGRRAWRELGLSKYNGIEGDNIDLDAVYDRVLDNDDIAFDPSAKVPTDKKELAEYLKRKKKAEEDLLRYGIGNNDKVDVDAGVASSRFGPRRAKADRVTEELKLDLSNAFENMPKAFDANVKFPDLMMTSDEITQGKLDTVVDALTASNGFLEAILESIPYAGIAGHGEDGEGPGPEDSPDTGGGGSGRRGWGRRILGGLGWATKGAVKGLAGYFKGSYKMIGKGLFGGAKLANWAARAPFRSITGLGVTDIYLRGSEDPVMTARDIRRGFYMDVKSGKIIESLRDIGGAVRDIRTNLLVLTEEDFAAGLYSGEGESLAGYLSRKAMGLAGTLARGTGWYMGATYGLMWKGAKKLTEVAWDQFVQFDAYFPGEDEPRITSKKMKRGYYRDEEGQPIMSLKDIKGAVYDIEGNLVVSLEELQKYKSFYTRNGSLLYTFGRGVVNLGGKALELGAKAAVWYGKQIGKFYKGMWSASKWTARKVGGLFGIGKGGSSHGAMGGMDDELGETMVEIQGRQLDTQLEMLNILRTAFDKAPVRGDTDGNGVRDWSWRDILDRRKAAKDKDVVEGGDNSDVVDALDKLGDRLDTKLEDLIETTEEAGENSWLENAADMADIKDGMGGGKRGRRGARRPPRGKAGWLRRGWEATKAGAKWAWNSPMLRAGAMFAGTTLLRGGAMLLGGAASLIGGAISLPALAIAAVVGVVAYAGYRYYKANQAKSFPLFYLRMAQYGVNGTDEKRVAAMLEVEKQAAAGLRIGTDGKATMDASGINMDALAQKFGLDSQERVQQFANWVGQRFRPVFLAHSTAMQQIHGHTNLAEADKGIGDGDLEMFMSSVNLPGMDKVYDDVDTSPFDSDLDMDADDVKSAVANVRDRRNMDKLSGKANNIADKVAVAGVTATAAATANQKADGVTRLNVSAKGSDDPRQIASGLKLTATGLAGAGGAAMMYAAKASSQARISSLNIPTAVRYKTYGLVEFELPKCTQLQQVEEVYWDNVVYSGTSKATFAGDEDKLKQKVFDIFKPATDLEHEEVTRWLEYRFIPAFLQYCISIRRRYNGDARDGWRNLTGTLMKEVLDETTRAAVETMFSSRSVWEVQNSPWPGYQLEKLPGSTKMYIEALDTGDTSKVLDVQGMESQARTQASNNDYGTKLSNIALGNTRANPIGPGVGNNNSTLGNYANIFSGKSVAGGASGQSPSGYGDGSMLYKGSFGNVVQHPGGGTGGDINSLPDNRGAGLAEMGPIITGAAKMVGFDPTISLNVAATESGLDPKASSGIANGLFQFIGTTWDSMLTRYGPKYGIAPGTPPTDPRANAILGVCYLKENYEGLKQSLGKDITDLDLYMAHFLGLGGAKRFLAAPRGDAAYLHVGNGSATPQKRKRDGGNAVVGSNASIFLKDYKSPNPTNYRNVGEILAEMDRRMNIGRKKAGNPASSTATSETPSSVPSNGAPSDTTPANGGVAAGGDAPAAAGAGGPAIPGVSSPAVLAGAGGDKTTPSSVLDQAAAASSSASASSIPASDPAPATPGPDLSSLDDLKPAGFQPSAPQPTPVSASQAAAKAAADSSEIASQANMESTNSILNEQLTVAKDSRQLLADIKGLLESGALMKTPADPQQQTPRAGQLAKSEPFPRNPVSNKRTDAVT
jgi:hypothetical protein